MKLQQMMVFAILTGFLAFGIVLGCSQDAPTETGLVQGQLGEDFETTRKKKKAKRKAGVSTFAAILTGAAEVPAVDVSVDAHAQMKRLRGGALTYSIRLSGADGLTGAPVEALMRLEPDSLMTALGVPVEKMGRMLVIQDALRNCFIDWENRRI